MYYFCLFLLTVNVILSLLFCLGKDFSCTVQVNVPPSYRCTAIEATRIRDNVTKYIIPNKNIANTMIIMCSFLSSSEELIPVDLVQRGDRIRVSINYVHVQYVTDFVYLVQLYNSGIVRKNLFFVNENNVFMDNALPLNFLKVHVPCISASNTLHVMISLFAWLLLNLSHSRTHNTCTVYSEPLSITCTYIIGETWREDTSGWSSAGGRVNCRWGTDNWRGNASVKTEK